tara:strand:+ start:146 stop:415 length:270 start_codon:yes stop_codon:yes gene_type:complete
MESNTDTPTPQESATADTIDSMALYKAMMEQAMFMRPQLTLEQVDEVILRTLKDCEDEDEDVVLRLEFHADDVLGYGDDEYAFPKKVSE